jgi:ADP-ribose pyrophosphatase YjhB (NUDIX family)
MELNYCTACAAPLTKKDATEYVCDNGHPYWNEPRASASVVLLQNGQVLVAKRGIEPRKGKYVFPGGFVAFGESPYDAARRETREETGVEPLGLTLLEVHTVEYRKNEASLSIVFHAPRWRGEPRAGDDAAELAWKPIDFIDGEDFAWPYPGLAAKLRAL